MPIPVKSSKLIVKSGDGLVQILPEIKVDEEMTASSPLPVSSGAVHSALEELDERMDGLGQLEIAESEPAQTEADEMADEVMIACLGSTGPEVWSITESIYDDGDSGQIPFCLYGIENASITIDWGDGTVQQYRTADAVEHECPTHEYAAAGDYVITMTSSDFSRMYLQTIFIEGNDCPRRYLSTLKAVNSPIPKVAGVQGQSGMYDSSIGDYAWENRSNSLQTCFFYCTSLETIPSNLFENNTGVTSFVGAFSACDALHSIPCGLFEGCTAATDFSGCFSNCYSLSSLPEDLFSECIAAARFDYCFNRCNALNDFTIHIGSANVEGPCYGFADYKENVTRILYVPSGSLTQSTFEEYSPAITVIGE